MRLRLCALALAVLSFATAPLSATPIVFFGQDVNLSGNGNVASTPNSNAAHSSFVANLTGTSTQTFESYAAGTGLPLTISFGAAGTATLNDPTGGSAIVAAPDNGRFAISGVKYLETGAGSGFTITFSQPISAFGFYGTDVGDFGGILSLGLGGANPTSLVVPATVGTGGSTSGSALYYGFYDTQNSYTSISFNNMGSGGVDIFGFDDFTIGSLAQVTPVAATPEPSAFLLLGTGMSALAGLRRYRRR